MCQSSTRTSAPPALATKSTMKSAPLSATAGAISAMGFSRPLGVSQCTAVTTSGRNSPSFARSASALTNAPSGASRYSARAPIASAISPKPWPNIPFETARTLSPGFMTLFIAPQSASIPSPEPIITSFRVWSIFLRRFWFSARSSKNSSSRSVLP